MAESYRFFNSEAGDIREYPANDFAEYFAQFLSNGVYATDNTMGLKVSINSLQVSVGVGYAFLRGRLYKNDAVKTYTLDAADNIQDRIDRIVIKLDIINRTILMGLKKGTISSTPTAPALIDDASVLEIPLAQIRVKAKATVGIVTDERVPVSSLITIPLADIQQEWITYLNDLTGTYESWEQDKDSNYSDWKTNMETIFDNWFDGINEILDESVAGNLLSLINTNTQDIVQIGDDVIDLQTNKMNNSRIHLSTSDAVASEMADGDIWIKYS